MPAQLHTVVIKDDDYCDNCGKEGCGRRGVVFGMANNVEGESRFRFPLICCECIGLATLTLALGHDPELDPRLLEEAIRKAAKEATDEEPPRDWGRRK